MCLQKILISKQSGQHKRAEREQEKKKKFRQDKEEKKKKGKKKNNLKTASQPLLDIYTTTPLRSKENKNGVCVAAHCSVHIIGL